MIDNVLVAVRCGQQHTCNSQALSKNWKRPIKAEERGILGNNIITEYWEQSLKISYSRAGTGTRYANGHFTKFM